MGKKVPKLTLVSKDSSASLQKSLGVAEGFNFVAVGELGTTESKRLERLLEEVCPRAGIIAVARTSWSWDLRPVVVLAEEDGPSLIRSAGPEVSIAESINANLTDALERVSKFKDLSSELRDWGVFEDQVWYRRNLVSATLAHRISGKVELDINQFLAFIPQAVGEISDWHSHGVVHGHIVTSNIYLSPAGEVAFLDPGIGAAVVQAAKEAPTHLIDSIAPEILAGEVPQYSADVYGLGQVIRRLVLVVRKEYQFSEKRAEVERLLEPYQRLTNAMLDPERDSRPTLSEIRSSLKEIFRAEQGEAEKKEATPARDRGIQGRIVRPGVVASQRRVRDDDSRVPQEEKAAEREPVSTEETLSELPVYSGGPDVDTTIYKTMSEGKNQELSPKEETPSSTTEEAAEENPFSGWLEEDEEPRDEAVESFFEQESDVDVEDVGQPAPQSILTPEPSTEKTPERTAVRPQSEGSLWPYAFLLGILLLGVWYYFRGVESEIEQPEYYPAERLILFWESRIPSKMAKVAQAAVQDTGEDNFAADIIIRSANHGDQLPEGVDIGLLRIAFNSKWEMELSPDDRRMALALALSGLLRQHMPPDLGAVEDRHPGVILAVTASAGENVRRFLRSVPAERLASLPPPYGPAFRRLVEAREGIDCADESVQLLARFGTRGIQSKEDLAVFLRRDSTVHLQALALMFSAHNKLARLLLDILLKHPNFVLQYEEIEWARKWKLLEWKGLEEGDQLFVLSGIAPAGRVGVENVAMLFTHPNSRMRAYAIDQALDRIKFVHPGSYEVMQEIKKDPGLLTPEQLFGLARLLENPDRASDENIRDWLQSEPTPPETLIAKLLITSGKGEQGTKLDAWFAVYLRTRHWKAEVTDLQVLSKHPDDYTRMVAYDQIFKMNDRQAARTLLQSAFAKEKNSQFRSQLQRMIDQLGQ